MLFVDPQTGLRGSDLLTSGISVVIPSWNGKYLLEKCLPSVQAALERWNGEAEIIVVDDASKDGTPEFLAESYPQVRCERMPRRRGFVHTANRGFSVARYEFVCLLNNDITVEPDFFPPLILCFEDERVFAVSAKAFEVGTGKLSLGQRLRQLENFEIVGGGREFPAENTNYTYFASGGASVFRTRTVMELGAFDEIYAPYYTEDTDLSYRAWKRGYVVLYEPRAVAHHIGSASIIGKSKSATALFFTRFRVSVIIHRNAVLFYTKNFTDPDLRMSYRKKIIKWGLESLIRFRFTFFLGIIASMPRLAAALARNKTEKRESVISDQRLFEILNTDYSFERTE